MIFSLNLFYPSIKWTLISLIKSLSPIIGIILFLVFCSACEQKTKEVDNPSYQKKATVLVTISPYSYFVKRIAQNVVSVQTLIPAGVNPHIFEPTPKEVEKAFSSVIWFRSKEPFEKKILKVLKEQNSQLKTIDLTEELPLIFSDHKHDRHEENYDLHLWLSPKIARQQARRIAKALIELYPEYEKFFVKQLGDLIFDIDALERRIRTLLAPFQNQTILVSHPAFEYFCKDFGLTQLSIEHEGKDPLPQNLSEILKKTQVSKIRSILTQAQYNNKGAELIAEKLHLPIYEVDPYSEDYLKNLEKIATLIAK